jgi:hypothetical protein
VFGSVNGFVTGAAGVPAALPVGAPKLKPCFLLLLFTLAALGALTALPKLNAVLAPFLGAFGALGALPKLNVLAGAALFGFLPGSTLFTALVKLLNHPFFSGAGVELLFIL